MNSFKKSCMFYERECIECGECDRCDLDPEKICDNCMKCVNGNKAYRAVLIDGIEAPNVLPKRTVSRHENN